MNIEGNEEYDRMLAEEHLVLDAQVEVSRLKEAAGLTDQQLCERLGITTRRFDAWMGCEAGGLTLRRLANIAHACGGEIEIVAKHKDMRMTRDADV